MSLQAQAEDAEPGGYCCDSILKQTRITLDLEVELQGSRMQITSIYKQRFPHVA